VPGPRIVVAALGDSITAGSPGWDPNPRLRARDADPESQYEFWAAAADSRLEFRNCGVYGQRTDEIARRLDGCAQAADVLVVQGGINDIAQGRPVEGAAENLRRMLQRGRELGLRVLIANVLPWNNGYPAADAEIRRLNALIDAVAVSEDVPVLPFYETLEDTTRPGRMRAEWTSDGDHPSIVGYRRLGELAFRLPGD
jgi:lysophospholipase L1-like esterase